MRVRNVSWQEINAVCGTWADELPQAVRGFGVDKVATCSRGGLFPARVAMGILGISKLVVDPKTKAQCENAVFVDDILDSGATLARLIKMARREMPSAFFYKREQNDYYPPNVYYARVETGKAHLIFPWERWDA